MFQAFRQNPTGRDALLQVKRPSLGTLHVGAQGPRLILDRVDLVQIVDHDRLRPDFVVQPTVKDGCGIYVDDFCRLQASAGGNVLLEKA